MKFKFKQPSNFASLEKMSDDALAKYFDKRTPVYRKALSKLTSFLKMFFGRVFTAFASETIIDVSGGGEGGSKKTAANGLTVEKFKAPGPRALRGYIDDLESIDYINELAYQMDRAAASESKALLAQLKTIEKMRNALVDAYVAAMDAMESIAQKHIPDAVGTLFKGAADTAQSLLPEDFELGSYLYVGVNGKEADFVLNLDLSNDDAPSLVVVTARLVPVDDHFDIRVYVNHLSKMALPGQYNIGTAVEGADVKAIIKKLKPAIEHEISLTHVVNLLGALAIPVDETDIEKKLLEIEGVEGVSFEQDESDAVTAIHFEIPGISSADNEVAKSARAAAFRIVSANTKVKALVRKQYSLNLVNDEDHCTITLTHKG